jgi:DNA-binding CsgD family transcriptional regulator/membrane-bound acyltransferase YfiQ involved in biofilm formation
MLLSHIAYSIPLSRKVRLVYAAACLVYYSTLVASMRTGLFIFELIFEVVIIAGIVHYIQINIRYFPRLPKGRLKREVKATLVWTICGMGLYISELALRYSGFYPGILKNVWVSFFIYYALGNVFTFFFIAKYYFAPAPMAIPENEILPTFAASYGLTERESEIVRRIVVGKSNKEIVREFQISDKTVRNHVHNIYRKTRTRNRVSLLRKLNIQ